MTEFIVNYDYPENVIQFPDNETLFRNIADKLEKETNIAFLEKRKYYLAVSGGNTPRPLYNLLPESDSIKWEILHLFWVDERMVPETSDESNYKSAQNLVKKIPVKNVHKINGINNPDSEAGDYEQEINRIVTFRNGLPSFDWIWLGLGNDGHTASIFPGDTQNDNLIKTAVHPVTHQKRITFTEKLINNSKEILFIVTGTEKKDILQKVLIQKDSTLPASGIKGNIKWYISLNN